MIRKFTSLVAAIAVTMATLAPAAADARDRRGHGYYDRGHNSGYYDHRRRGRDRHDNGDAVAAGVVGLVLGLAIGSMANQSERYDRYDRRDGYYRRPPARGCYDPCDRSGYYGEGDYDPRYEEGYDPYYERSQCTRRERQWDRYAQRYVTVDVPC